MTKRNNGKTPEGTTGAKARPWELPLWTGMDTVAWFKLLARHRFAVDIRRMGRCCILSAISVANTLLNALNSVFYKKKIAATKIELPPLFIIGHWRTGTTLLHELLVCDQRHAFPTTYECFASSHFLLSAWFLKRWFQYLMPKRRPMDNMQLGLDRPQEDEFAFCGLGVPSPYMDWAFPNNPLRYEAYLDLQDISPDERDRWKHAFVRFLKSLTYKNAGKRIVLKSPAHTYRVRTLLELFPNAKFVHIVRDPFVVFPSTVYTWERMQAHHGMQIAKYRGLEEQVFRRFERMHKVFEEDRKLIDPSRFCELRYEDLVDDPVGQVRAIYDQLELGEFNSLLPQLEKYVASVSGYRTNRFEISPELRGEIRTRCAAYIEKYGYAV
jgi:hypothetical protein